MKMGRPVAKLTYQSEAQSQWWIEWPSQNLKWGKVYYARTYPGSDLIFVETAARRRPVSALQGRKLIPQIREAIERALTQS